MKRIIIPLLCSFFFISCGNKSASRQFYEEAVENYRKQDFQETIKLADLCLKNDPGSTPAIFLKAKACFFMTDFSEAAILMKKLHQSESKNFDYGLWLLRTYIFSSKYLEAEKLLQELLPINVEDWRLYYWAAQLAIKKENFEEYFTNLNKAEEILKNSAQVYQELALIWNEFGLSDRYKKYYSKMETIRQ